MHHTKYNLDYLLRKLALKNNRDYETQQVAKASGLSRFTIASIRHGDSVRIELRTIDKLRDFFAAEGMPITPGDLFVDVTE